MTPQIPPVTIPNERDQIQALSDQISTALGSDPKDFRVELVGNCYTTVDLKCGKRWMWGNYNYTARQMRRLIDYIANKQQRQLPEVEASA